jgi:hypothetical protein
VHTRLHIHARARKLVDDTKIFKAYESYLLVRVILILESVPSIEFNTTSYCNTICIECVHATNHCHMGSKARGKGEENGKTLSRLAFCKNWFKFLPTGPRL